MVTAWGYDPWHFGSEYVESKTTNTLHRFEYARISIHVNTRLNVATMYVGSERIRGRHDLCICTHVVFARCRDDHVWT